MPLLDHFNLVAPFYDRAIQLKQVGELIEILKLPVEGAVLDAGGGTGRVARALLPYVGQIVVADLAFGMLKQAQQKDNLELAQAHTEWLPFPSNSFDRIIMVDALHHVCDQKETADELWRVLKPGGRIVIEEPDVRTFPVKLVAFAERIALMRSKFLTPPAIKNLFLEYYPKSEIRISGWNSWISIDKPG